MTTDVERLHELVNYFVNFDPHRHFGNLAALNQIAEDVQKWFNEFGLETSRQTWKVRGNDYHNIIGKYKPELTNRLVVGAHYDVYANQPGADDNASGMAGLIEAARLTAGSDVELEFGIDFVAFSLEEPPFFGTADMGSYVHAKSLFDDAVDVKGMICYDMIGYYSDEPNSQQFPHASLADIYPSTANFILVIGCQDYAEFAQTFHTEMKDVNEIDVQLIIFPDSNDLGGLSDHRNYWAFGYHALMINNSAFMRNPNYHEKTDTIGTLDFVKMKAVIDASIQAICRL
jgi:Zn-dependent M28 family amino/carboxypeptidase